MLCLGIESSCDETALALVRDEKIVGQLLNTQADLHALFGGVVPEIASREHGRTIGALYDALLEKTGVRQSDIDAVAVARGPGLLGSLLVGIAFAKGLALSLGKPIIGVNHLHAHILAAGLENSLRYPFLALLVSGGHTHIYLVESPSRFILLGRSIDDAAGEAMDKFGKMLGLPYPAGKYIDFFASSGTVVPDLFPRPYLHNDNLDFSFSGLKTAALTLTKNKSELRFTCKTFGNGADSTITPVMPTGKAGSELASLCASYTHAVALTLVEKTGRALDMVAHANAGSVVLAGGVAANSMVRSYMRDMCEKRGIDFIVPSPALCTDNAVMIAHAGELLQREGFFHHIDFAAIPRGQQVPDDYCAKLS